jgi:RNA polymerase primary sigma factor
MASRPAAKKPSVKKSLVSGGSEDSMTLYLIEISKIKLLSREEEKFYADKIAEGNVKALQELVRRNLKYVVSVAKKYRGLGMSLQDLVEEGNIGLIQAAKRFDGSRHVKFITYAVWWIKQAILHSLAEQSGTVKLPVKQAGKVFKINKQKNALAQTLQREPTQSELAELANMREDEIDSIMRAYRTHLSLDMPLRSDEATPYIDLLESPETIPYDDQIMQESLKTKIDEMLKGLSPREEKILRLRFGFEDEPKTLEEIGRNLGLSRERIRQIEKRAKAKLLSLSTDSELLDHIG